MKSEATRVAPIPMPQRSTAAFNRACAVMPDGNTRHTVYFEPHPIYAESALGCELTDLDGNVYLDFVNNYSALIHGHRDERVAAAIRAQIERLISVGLPTLEEVSLAEALCKRIGSIEEIRFANSGTEAVMLAVKAARAATGRAKIAKLEGAYHGSYEAAEISQAPNPDVWGPPQRPASVAVAQGTPPGVIANTLVLPYNDVAAALAILQENAADLSAVLLDVAPSHVAYLPLSMEFLQMVRDFTRASGALLILDEVYSFRYAYGGAQQRFAVAPDLTILGKVIGGGFPIGAVGGTRAAMSVFRHRTAAPKLPHGGTYNGNPVTMAAGIAALEAFDRAEVLRLEQLGEQLRQRLRECINITGFPAQVTGLASVAALVMTSRPLNTYRDLRLDDTQRNRLVAFHRGMLEAGILMDSRGTIVLSTAMTPVEVERFAEAALITMRRLS